MAAPESGPTQIPSGSVIITPEDMWRAIEEIRDTGRRTENSVNELKISVNPALNDLREDLDTNARIEREHHEKTNSRIDAVIKDRIRPLEEASWSSRWVPAIVMSVLVGAIVAVVGFVLSNLRP